MERGHTFPRAFEWRKEDTLGAAWIFGEDFFFLSVMIRSAENPSCSASCRVAAPKRRTFQEPMEKVWGRRGDRKPVL